MDTVILEVADAKASEARFIEAWESGAAEKAARIGFTSPDLLWQVLSTKRWTILKAMTGAGVIGVRELARRVGRDVKAVHADTNALASAGVIDKVDGGKLLFPYKRVEMHFALNAEEAACALPA